MLNRKKKPFRICLLNSPANPAQFGWKLAGLAVFYIRQILNSSQDFFFGFNIFFFGFFRYETIETYARAFLTLIILAIGTVYEYAEKPEDEIF